jgi:ribosomal protein L32
VGSRVDGAGCAVDIQAGLSTARRRRRRSHRRSTMAAASAPAVGHTHRTHRQQKKLGRTAYLSSCAAVLAPALLAGMDVHVTGERADRR